MEASQWNIRSPAYSNVRIGGVHVPVYAALYCTVHMLSQSRTASQPATASFAFCCRLRNSSSCSKGSCMDRNASTSINWRRKREAMASWEVQSLRRCTLCCSVRVRTCRYPGDASWLISPFLSLFAPSSGGQNRTRVAPPGACASSYRVLGRCIPRTCSIDCSKYALIAG